MDEIWFVAVAVLLAVTILTEEWKHSGTKGGKRGKAQEAENRDDGAAHNDEGPKTVEKQLRFLRNLLYGNIALVVILGGAFFRYIRGGF